MNEIINDLDCLCLNDDHIQIVKIQSYFRMKHWYIDRMNFIIKLIHDMYRRDEKPYKHENTIFGNSSEKTIECLGIAHKLRQRQMKEGLVSQILIGNWFGWMDLGIGHPSGLDVKRCDNSIIIELKNKYNTCNSSSLKTVLDKLADYKRLNPHTRCVFGIVNPKPRSKCLYEKITHNGFELEKIQGNELFKLVFSIDKKDYSKNVIRYIQRNQLSF